MHYHFNWENPKLSITRGKRNDLHPPSFSTSCIIIKTDILGHVHTHCTPLISQHCLQSTPEFPLNRYLSMHDLQIRFLICWTYMQRHCGEVQQQRRLIAIAYLIIPERKLVASLKTLKSKSYLLSTPTSKSNLLKHSTHIIAVTKSLQAEEEINILPTERT